jgi:hydrogenase maturation protein HypF
VSVIVEGREENVMRFRNDILKYSPGASHIKSIAISPRKINGFKSFRIVESKHKDDLITEVSPDIAVCDECLKDMESDPDRISYPFINCTNCGPRFTIIENLPYDRCKTSMKNFVMCTNCDSEYNDVLNRRFHAQPIACNRCGPVYYYVDQEVKLSEFEEILGRITARISAGKSVAIKGLGGYHLMCDALDNDAVSNLRKMKHRDTKPFAVLFRDIFSIMEYCYVDDAERHELESWRRPILILDQKKELPYSVNNGLNTIGAMLPYMPLHYLLFNLLETNALILTSGNISDEPIIIDDNEALNKLMIVAGSVLSYNRDIVNRTDDSVIRIIDGKFNLIRRSRGFVPSPVDLASTVEGILAVGAEQKNSFCIGKDKQAIMSQYIGDLKNIPTYDFFRESINRFQQLFLFEPQSIACDLHPDYLSSVYAEELEKELHIPLIRVQHHHAHIASCMAENLLEEKVIGISMDGTGYGSDGHIWGSEFLIADLKGFTRYTHFDYVPMPGGDRAADEPWRMAFSYLYKYFGEKIDLSVMPALRSVPEQQISLIKEMIDKKINTPLTSGAGRLFDAVSALLGLCTVSGFDSEAPIRLEAVTIPGIDSYYPFDINDTIVFANTLGAIIDDLRVNSIAVISTIFHNTVATAIVEMSKKIRQESLINKVVLSGGVFQNKYLLDRLIQLLTRNNFEVYTNHLVPANDGGISLGQMIIASKTKDLCV